MQSVQVSAVSARQTCLKKTALSPTRFWKIPDMMEKHFMHKQQQRSPLQTMGLFPL